MRSLFAVVTLAAVLATGAAAQRPRPKLDKKDLRADLEAVLDKAKLPALGAAVVTSDGLLVADVVGVRRRGYKPAATVADQFHLGSDTKAITALLAAILVHKGKLSYDLTLAKAFPELATKMPRELRDVTLEQLLTHTAGLRNNEKWRDIASPRLSVRQQRMIVVNRVLTARPEHEPGSKHQYSNVSYVIAGAMMERAMNAAWEDLVRQHVAGPLKMSSLGFGPPGRAVKIEQPWAHDSRGRSVEPGPAADDPPVVGPATRVHCALGDWAKLIADQLKGAQGKGGLLPAAAYKKLHEPHSKEVTYSVGGWYVDTDPGAGKVLNHDGSNGGFYAHALVIPSLDVAILVVTNQGGEVAPKACHAVRQMILARLFKS